MLNTPADVEENARALLSLSEQSKKKLLCHQDWSLILDAMKRRGKTDQEISRFVDDVCGTKFMADRSGEVESRKARVDSVCAARIAAAETLLAYFGQPVEMGNVNSWEIRKAAKSLKWMKNYLTQERDYADARLKNELAIGSKILPPHQSFQRMMLTLMAQETGGPASDVVASLTNILYEPANPVTKESVANMWSRLKRALPA